MYIYIHTYDSLVYTFGDAMLMLIPNSIVLSQVFPTHIVHTQTTALTYIYIYIP